MTHAEEITLGERFPFGENWARFLSILSEERIQSAELSLREMLETGSLNGKTFLDAGSGSGLFSLAARRLGARVYSFDYDPQSVACTMELKRRYFPGDPDWTAEQASVLDKQYLGALGKWDVVYSWGVLHHTGALWQALDNVAPLVADGGRLFIAIYNDQGPKSRGWLRVKKAYNAIPTPLKSVLLGLAFMRLWGPTTIRDIAQGHPFRTWRDKKLTRGMSPWHDVVDWVGGLPFEVAKPEEIFDFFRERDFLMRQLKTCAGGHGCNEFVFLKSDVSA